MITGIPHPVGITYCANGAIRTKRDFLGLPVTVEELVSSALKAREAGAAIFNFTIRQAKSEYCVDPGPVQTGRGGLAERIGWLDAAAA